MAESKLSAKQFEDLLMAGKIEPLERALHEMSVEERKVLSPAALKVFRKAGKGKVSFAQNKVTWEFPLGLDVTMCASIAAICTAEPEDLLTLNWSTIPDEYFDRPIYKQLKPAGAQALGEIILSKHLTRIGIVRKLYKAGVCPKPTSEKYYLALYALHQNNFATFAEYLLDNKDIIEQDIWHFFEIEGNGENSLAARDKYSLPQQKWETALVQLSKDGHIDRQKLLTETLKTLALGFAQFRAGWYSALHESLCPSPEERAARIDLYGELLSSPIPPTVSFALKAVDVVDKHAGLSTDFIEQYLPAVMHSDTKGVIGTALSIIERAVKKDKTLASSAGRVVCQALNHPAPEMQSKALAFIKKYLDKEQIIALNLNNYGESLAPSARAELSKVIGNDKDISQQVTAEKTAAQKLNTISERPKEKLATSNASAKDTYTNDTSTGESSRENSTREISTGDSRDRVHYKHREQESTDWPFLTNAEILPIESIDELIERAAFCLENQNEVAEIERVMDAISSLDYRQIKDFSSLGKPLAKRAKTLLDKKSYKSDCHALYADFILSWLSGNIEPLLSLNKLVEESDRFKRKYALDAFEQLIWCRMRTILERISKGVYLPLPGMSTHSGGWLSPETFIDRCEIWQKQNVPIEEAELIFCLMRVPPAMRAKLSQDKSCPKLLSKALQLLQIVPDASSKGTGLFEKVTGAIQHVKELLGKDQVILRMAEEANLPMQQRKIWRDEMFSISWQLDRTRWQALSFPAMRESFFDRGVTIAHSQIRYSDSQVRVLRGYFETLLERQTVLSKRSNTLITTGLFLADPEIIGLTVDALILWIDEARLVIKDLGDEIIPFLHGEISKQARFAKTLKEVARVGPIHKNATIQLLEYSLHRPEDSKENDLWALLELLHELLVDTGAKLSDPETKTYLQSLATAKSGGKSTSKTGKLAAKILAL